MVTGQLVISTAEGGPALLVEDLYVVQKSRGRGIGRMLLEKIGIWAHGHGAKRLQLLADRDNLGALQFYRATGWQPTRLICLRKYHDGEKS
jgi:GNAT superfamily N-acetyltransferase